MANLKKITTQIAVDVWNLTDGLKMARNAAKADVQSIRALRKVFPDHPIVADTKTMDGDGVEAEKMFDMGARGRGHDS